MVTCFLGVGRAFRIVASFELGGWAGVVESRSQCPLQAPCGDYVPPAEGTVPTRPSVVPELVGRAGGHGGTAPTIRWGCRPVEGVSPGGAERARRHGPPSEPRE